MQERRHDVEPALVGHDDVHQDHVGLQRTRLKDRVARVARLTDRLEVVLGVDQQLQAGAKDGVVVDDQHADAHASGTSATSVAPAPSPDSICSRPSSRPTRSRIPSSPKPPSRTEAGSKPCPSSSITAATAPGFRDQNDADVACARVLDDVREGLLDDAVERGLHLGRKPLRREAGLEAYPDPGLRAERLGQPLERRDEAEVVEHLRPQLDREPAHVMQRRDDELAHVGDRLRALVALDLLLERLQAEQDRRERLAGLVVQLACEPAPLELLRVDDAPERVACDALREIDRDGCA